MPPRNAHQNILCQFHEEDPAEKLFYTPFGWILPQVLHIPQNLPSRSDDWTLSEGRTGLAATARLIVKGTRVSSNKSNTFLVLNMTRLPKSVQNKTQQIVLMA